MQAKIENIRHPEYGAAAISFPISGGEYEHVLSLLKALEIGDALRQDCYVQSLESGYPVLKRLEGAFVNLDELDYLAKRLDSFDEHEKLEFNATAVRHIKYFRHDSNL